MKSKHTPGPWHTGHGPQASIVYDRSGWGVANASVYHFKHEHGSALANAALIAAAPDLLEALEEIVLHQEILGQCSTITDRAYEAIAKAKGEQP